MTPVFLYNLIPTTPYNLPDAIVLDSALDVYVADAGANRVVEFNSSGNQINVFNTDNSSVVSPSGLAIDASGNVYVSSLDGVIQKLSGGIVTNIGTVPGVARGIAYDPYNGLLYVTTQFPGTIYTISTSGGSATFFANVGVGSGSGNLRGLAFGSGNLYVSDTSSTHNTGAIYEFPGASNTSILFASNLRGPNYITVDPLGSLFVAEYYGNDVLQLASNGTVVGPFITGLDGPSGIALATATPPVPEPTSLFLLGSGLAGLAALRRWRRAG